MENKSYSGSSAAADETLRRSHHLSEQLADITAKVLRFTNAGGAAIAIGSGDVAVTKAASGDLAPDLETPIRLEGSFAGLCIREGELLYCEDAENDPRVDAATSAAMGLRSMVMVPIGERTKICGVLAAFSGTPGAFRPTHIAVLRTLADIVHELIVREEQTKASETQSVRRYEAPVATPPAPEFSIAPPPTMPPARSEAPAPVMSAAPAPSYRPEPPTVAPVERMPESSKVIEIPRLIQTPFNVPTAAPELELPRPEAKFSPVIEPPKPVEPPKPHEAPKAVEAPVVVEPSKFVESKKDKEPLPSVISLTNQAKRAETVLEPSDADVLPAAADPLTKPLVTTSSAAAVKPAPSPKAKQRKETLPVPHKSSPVESAESTPMFRGLEHSTPESSPTLKYAGIAVLGLVVLTGSVWGIRSLMRRPAQQAAPVAQAPAAAEPIAQPPATDLTLSATAAGGTKASGTTAAASLSATSKTETKPDAKTESRREAVIVSNKVAAMPHRANQGDLDAPQVALNGGSGNLGALMAGKSVTPTLNVKRSSLSPPDVIHRVPPKFPEFARRSNPAGDRVVLNVTVGKDGRVGNIQVVRGQPMFTDAAVNAVKQWQYRPAFLNGEAVEATVEVVISFTNGR